jgi:hypothetical protein
VHELNPLSQRPWAVQRRVSSDLTIPAPFTSSARQALSDNMETPMRDGHWVMERRPPAIIILVAMQPSSKLDSKLTFR